VAAGWHALSLGVAEPVQKYSRSLAAAHASSGLLAGAAKHTSPVAQQ
jgi:hypothetical protein